MSKEAEGVWRTIRGRRIFIGKGEDLATAMKNSGKFNDNGRLPKREDYHKAKKQLALEEANEKENKAYDYVYKKPKDEKQKEQWKKKADKATENRIKANKDYNDYMDLYDKDRDDSELSWQDKAEKIHRKGEKIRESKSPRDNDYYDTYRNEEEQFSKIKEEPDDAPYESLPAYKTYQEKMMKLEKENKSWTGKEYTNDEFMEHLTDANWHTERKMIEEAGLTNKQMTELKNQVKLSSWSANLDKKSTQELIDKVKKEFPAKDTKKTIEDFKAKKQSNNKTIHTQSGDYSENELKQRDNEIKQLYKDTWEGKTSYKELNDKLEDLKKNGNVSQGELDSLKYDASLETGDWQNNPYNAHRGEYIGNNVVVSKDTEYPRAKGATKFEDLGLQVSDKKAFSDYLQDKYGTDDFRIINFDSKDGAKQIYNDYASKREYDRVSQYFKDEESHAFNNKDYSYGFSKETLQKMETDDLQKYVKKQEELYNKYKNAHAQSKMSDQRKKANKQDVVWNSGLETKYKHQYENALNEVARREETIKKYKQKKGK